jgi:hypothetical protein
MIAVDRVVVAGIRFLKAIGSKVEKISGIIKIWSAPIRTLKVLSFFNLIF